MASKVPIKQTKSQPAAEPAKDLAVPAAGGPLTNITSFLPTHDVANEMETPDSGAFFPALKLVFPIEIKPQSPFTPEDQYKVGLTDGDSFTPLEAGYILSVLDSRNAAREERATVDDAGKPTGKEYVRTYQGIERGGKTFSKTHAAYVDQHKRASLKEASFVAGGDFVVAVIKNDGTVAIAEMALFKTQRAYWQKHLMQTQVVKGVGMQVKIESHFPNVVESGSGNAYPGPKKFTQFDLVQLEQDQIKAIATALQEAGDAYMQWLDR